MIHEWVRTHNVWNLQTAPRPRAAPRGGHFHPTFLRSIFIPKQKRYKKRLGMPSGNHFYLLSTPISQSWRRPCPRPKRAVESFALRARFLQIGTKCYQWMVEIERKRVNGRLIRHTIRCTSVIEPQFFNYRVTVV